MANIFQKINRNSGRKRLHLVFVFIILLTLTCAFIDGGKSYNKGASWLSAKTGGSINLPKTKEIPFHLGLDLQGGSHLVYEAMVSEIPAKDRNSAVEGARDVIERRVNIFGVSEPVVQTNKTAAGNYRIIVELAGVKDVGEAIKMIGETPILEFKEQEENRELTEDEKKQQEDFNQKAEEKAKEVITKIKAGENFEQLAKEYSDDKETKEKGGELDWFTESDNPEVVKIIKELEPNSMVNNYIKTSKGYEIVKFEEKRIKVNPFKKENEKEVKASHILICYEGSSSCESGLKKEDAYEKIKGIKEEATVDNFKELAKKYSTGPSASNGGELGWFERGEMVEPFEDTVFDNQEVGDISYIVETQFGYHLIFKEDERDVEEYKASHILIGTISDTDILGAYPEWKNTELTGKNLKRSSVQFNPNDNTPEVSLEFDDEGANFFAELTKRNIGKPVAIFLDGYPISTPNVNEEITGGRAVISGNFNIKEAKLLAQRLNAGALPVAIVLKSQQTVGASLGKESVELSLRAGIIGLILVALFMIMFYRLLGGVAVLSLMIYGLIILAIFKIWPITLTLPGLAGFILSIGMAVDANVLIFERFKEEMRDGKPLSIAIEEAFERAWPSIRDGNISTLITCFILIQFSTSIVKGFAVTLSLGVIISMFSAVIITKNFLTLISGEWLEKRKWFLGAKSKD